MNICFFHGLESQGPSSKGKHLASLGWEVCAPTINYHDPESIADAWSMALSGPRSAFIGSSMGGWMATLLASHTATPAWLVNPAVIGRSIEPEFPRALGPERPDLHVLFGKHDDLINPLKASEWFATQAFDTKQTWINAGHRVPLSGFASWIAKTAQTPLASF